MIKEKVYKLGNKRIYVMNMQRSILFEAVSLDIKAVPINIRYAEKR